VGDEDLAKDVSQMVFSDLARKAGSLSREIVLGAWLHRATCYAAKRVLRNRQRIARRDQIMYETLHDQEAGASSWVEISRELDAALDSLSLVDRKAILLRFFERHDLRSVGIELGVSEDAAQKRVGRALERLREALWARGISSGTPSLALLLGANVVTDVPLSLAAGIAGTALSTAPVHSTGLLGSVALMTTKTTASALVILALGISTLWLRRSYQELRGENERLRVELGETSRSVGETGSSPAGSHVDDFGEGVSQSELLRLRGEVARLRRAAKETRRQSSESIPGPDHQSQPILADVGTATAEDAATTALWALTEGVRDRIPDLLVEDPAVGPEIVEKRQEFLFNAMSEAFSNRVMTGIDRIRTNKDGSISVYYAFQHRESGESNNVSLLMRPSPEGWRVDPGPPPEGL
jgi:RNA polymerase sigma factor (sigma-70 family)